MTGDVGGLPTTVAAVLAAVVSRGDRSLWAQALVEECARSLDAVGVGLAVADASGPVGVAAATHGAGRAGEDLQFALGEGPCQLASASRRPVASPVLARDGRWVQFAREAAQEGIAAAFSTPLQVGAVLVGVLDVYRGVSGPLSQASAAAVVTYADAATAVLLLRGSTGHPALPEGVELTDLADIRPVVHQASGMVAVQLGVDLATALVRLQAHAFGAGAPLRAVAAEVVARQLDLGDDSTGDDGPSGPGRPPDDQGGPGHPGRRDDPDSQPRSPDEHP